MIDQYYPGRPFEDEEYRRLEAAGHFQPTPAGTPYTIALPPPNVTGTLHMGHAFQSTLIDILIRYHRMIGHSCLWQPGTDHAGIATQLIVERTLREKGIDKHSLSREAFIRAVWDWKNISGSTILNQFKRLGVSADWSRDCFTMDAPYQEAVATAFIKLYQDGLIFRGERLVNWDTSLQTAVSDLEVIHTLEEAPLYFIHYPCGPSANPRTVTVATTRPETLFGDVALCVHPEDSRYHHLHNTSVAIPLTDRSIPLICDTAVDPAFGTGIVKITPGHDFNDHAMGKKHDLPTLNILNHDGTLNQHTPQAVRGKTVRDARKIVVQLLGEEQLLERIEKHQAQIPRGERSGTIIEPLITKQWFVDVTSERGKALLINPAREAVENGRIALLPVEWKTNYLQWIDTIQDWCISRQIAWGHQIPVWYDQQGNHYAGRSEDEVREQNQIAEGVSLRRDQDVLDTWFSSALWPFASLGWPQDKSCLHRYPNSILVTGFDILFFWVIRMILIGLYIKKDVPFKSVYIHGLVRDGEGQKMSKSKGNSIDPLDVIDGISYEKLLKKRLAGVLQERQKKQIERATKKHFPEGIAGYGIDALRFSFASMSNSGRDIKFDIKRIEGYKHFCNKVWNAGKFLQQALPQQVYQLDDHALAGATEDSRADWLQSRFNRALQKSHDGLLAYRFDQMAHALYHYTWTDYCSWYLEWVKRDIAENKPLQLFTLLHFRKLLTALSPLLPYTTAALLKELHPAAEASITLPYPTVQPQAINAPLEQHISHVQNIVTAIRNFRDQLAIPHKVELGITLVEHQKDRFDFIKHNSALIESSLRAVNFSLSTHEPPDCLQVQVESGNLWIDHKPSAQECKSQCAVIDKKIDKCARAVRNYEDFLARPAFEEHAPAAVLQSYRDSLMDAKKKKESLETLRDRLRMLDSNP